MSTDEDDAWFDALAGRAHGARTPARMEGEMLRDMLGESLARERTQRTAARTAIPDLAREQALIARARAEGLLANATQAAPTRPRARWARMLAAAALACLAIGVAWQTLDRPEPVVRDSAQEPVRLTADDPAALKRRILAALRAAGVEANGYEALGVQGIDADLPQPLSIEVRRVLATHDIAEPRDGALRIEIRERQ